MFLSWRSWKNHTRLMTYAALHHQFSINDNWKTAWLARSRYDAGLQRYRPRPPQLGSSEKVFSVPIHIIFVSSWFSCSRWDYIRRDMSAVVTRNRRCSRRRLGRVDALIKVTQAQDGTTKKYAFDCNCVKVPKTSWHTFYIAVVFFTSLLDSQSIEN